MAFIKKTLQFSRIIWIIFGNNEDPDVPEWYKANKKEWIREFMWFFIRNPLHNFMARVVGFRDKDWKLSIWKEKDGLNVVLPFISYRKGRFECYVGWRPDSRMLGFALRWHKKEVV